MPTCQCGCGGETAGDFQPGHDQRLRAAMERRMGGLLALRDLVNAATAYADGETTDQEFTQAVRAVRARAVREADSR